MIASPRVFTRTEPAFLRAVRLRAHRRVLWLRHWWSCSTSPPTQGLAISDADVDRFLADSGETSAEEALFYQSHPEAAALTRQVEDCDTQPDPRWRLLCSRCALNEREAALLALALMVEADPWWRRVCGYLHDDATAQFATLWLAASLWGSSEPWRLDPSSSLIRWRLARPVEPAAWSGVANWQADPELLLWLMGDDPLDAAGNAPSHCLYPEALRDLKHFVQGMSDAGMMAEVEISGPPGSGRGVLAAQLAREIGLPLHIADASGPQDVDRMLRASRRALLAGAALLWRNADQTDPAAWREVRGLLPLTIYGTRRRMEWPTIASAALESVALADLNSDDRAMLWNWLTGRPLPEEIRETPLRPAELAVAAKVALSGPEALAGAARGMLFQSPGDLVVELPLPYERGDLVVHAALRAHLDELEAHARHRYVVLEEWEFRRLTPMGTGLAALFAGPSGTGKTMAAQVLARTLGLALYRVDLSAVVNKYVGETEKRLKLVFDACERTPCILLFDEADALFGQRTQVKDAHDRFANIEINYLLQRMEQFHGVAVLATNRKDDLDRAFLRRLRFLIDFPAPGPAERREIWRRALPTKTKAGVRLLEEDINWDLLADRVELTGAGIKASALSAAFLAREEGTRIAARHVVAAVRRELQKQGHVVRPGDLDT